MLLRAHAEKLIDFRRLDLSDPLWASHFALVVVELQKKLHAKADELYLMNLIGQRSIFGLEAGAYAAIDKEITRTQRRLQRYYWPGVLGTDEEIEKEERENLIRQHEQRFGVKWDTEEAEDIDLAVREITRRQRRARQQGD